MSSCYLITEDQYYRLRAAVSYASFTKDGERGAGLVSNEFAALYFELDRLEKCGWQPIETAREGDIVWFIDSSGRQWSGEVGWDRGNPTHWQPLPPPQREAKP